MMEKAYNGWPASRNPADLGGLDNRCVPGSAVRLVPGVRAGDVATVLFHVAGALHARVEPAADPGCWGYFYKPSANSAALISVHSAGGAFDWNAPRHPNGKRGTFTPGQVAEIRAILAEAGGVVHWGGDGWGPGSVIDEMHFEIAEGVTPARLSAVAASLVTSSPAVPRGVQQQEEDTMYVGTQFDVQGGPITYALYSGGVLTGLSPASALSAAANIKAGALCQWVSGADWAELLRKSEQIAK